MMSTAFGSPLQLHPFYRHDVQSSPRVYASASNRDQHPSPSPPTTIGETITLASEGVCNAFDAGHKRVRVNALIPGLNTMVEDAYPYSVASLQSLARGIVLGTPPLRSLPSCSLLFESSGSAAMASQQYAQEDKTFMTSSSLPADASVKVVTSSFAMRDSSSSRSSPDANVIVAPTSVRGDRIMDAMDAIINENPSATWLLLNPDLSLDRAAVGMAESTRRSSFIASFCEAFYFRNIVSIFQTSSLTT